MTEVLFIALGLGLSFLMVKVSKLNQELMAEIKFQQKTIDYLKEVALPASIQREADWKAMADKAMAEARQTRIESLQLLHEIDLLKRQASAIRPPSNN